MQKKVIRHADQLLSCLAPINYSSSDSEINVDNSNWYSHVNTLCPPDLTGTKTNHYTSLKRNHKKAHRRKNKACQQANNVQGNFSPHITAHFLQINMHRSEVVVERLRRYIATSNSKLNSHETKLICFLQEPPPSKGGGELPLLLLTTLTYLFIPQKPH